MFGIKRSHVSAFPTALRDQKGMINGGKGRKVVPASNRTKNDPIQGYLLNDEYDRFAIKGCVHSNTIKKTRKDTDMNVVSLFFDYRGHRKYVNIYFFNNRPDSTLKEGMHVKITGRTSNYKSREGKHMTSFVGYSCEILGQHYFS